MLEKFFITVGTLCLGALLAWFFNRFAVPNKKMILLVPLVLPGVLWFGVSGQLKEVSGPGGWQIKFVTEAKSPIANFTSLGGLRPIFPGTPMTEQMALPAEARYIKDGLGRIGAHVLRGDKTQRLFYWFPYDDLKPKQLLNDIRGAQNAAHDEISEYLVFGPELGVVDCYILDVDFVQKEDELSKTLRALAAMPAAQRRAFLPKSNICHRPLKNDVPAIDALRRLDSAGHDEAIVVNDVRGYQGIAFRDTIISALVTSLMNALVDTK